VRGLTAKSVMPRRRTNLTIPAVASIQKKKTARFNWKNFGRRWGGSRGSGSLQVGHIKRSFKGGML